MAHLQSETTTAVATLLGGKKILKREVTAQQDMRAVLRGGLPFGALASLTKTLGIPTATVTRVLGIAPRTLARRKEQHSFSPAESDRLYRFARVAFRTVDVLGSHEKARQWLERPNRALGGEPPLDLLDTDIGARQVEAVLGRIEQGVFS
jgi:putative toxin-antitoxin system antitoxin component (TIGR02293 family)